jgi:hypothetical protein
MKFIPSFAVKNPLATTLAIISSLCVIAVMAMTPAVLHRVNAQTTAVVNTSKTANKSMLGDSHTTTQGQTTNNSNTPVPAGNTAQTPKPQSGSTSKTGTSAAPNIELSISPQSASLYVTEKTDIITVKTIDGSAVGWTLDIPYPTGLYHDAVSSFGSSSSFQFRIGSSPITKPGNYTVTVYATAQGSTKRVGKSFALTVLPQRTFELDVPTGPAPYYEPTSQTIYANFTIVPLTGLPWDAFSVSSSIVAGSASDVVPDVSITNFSYNGSIRLFFKNGAAPGPRTLRITVSGGGYTTSKDLVLDFE